MTFALTSALVLSRSASQILSIARNSSRTVLGKVPPSFATLAIWLMLRPMDASSAMLPLSASSSSFGSGDIDRRCARTRTDTYVAAGIDRASARSRSST